MSERPLVYVEFAPGDAVRDVALTYWGFQVRALPHPDFVHRVWPDGCISLTLVPGPHHVGAHILGVRQTPLEVPLQAGARFWGVRFRPEAGALWLGVDPTSIRDRNVSATGLLGDGVIDVARSLAALDDTVAVRAVLDRWIQSIEFARERIDTAVRDAVAIIVATEGRRAIADVARDVCVSPRALQRRFAATVGLSPKTFAVLRRGRSALKRVVTDGVGADVGGWSGVALSSGYADQAHFTREVARLTRFAPNALRARLETIDHEQLED